MEIKLVACDIDGTLINSKSECTPKTVEAIEALRKKGIKFAIASGRPVSGILPLLKGWNLEGKCDYIMGMNGGEVLNTHTGKKVVSYELEPSLIHEIIEIYEPMGYIPTYYDDSGLYVERMSDEVEVVAKRTATPVYVKDIRALTSTPQIKLMLIVEPKDMDKIESFYATHKDSRYIGFKTAKDLFEFNSPLLAKDVGIQIMASEMHISMDEVMAFGDTTNDVEMLKCVKYGICMANGSEDAKEVAYEICEDCDSDGIAKYLKKNGVI